MSEVIVNNPNILVDGSNGGGAAFRRQRPGGPGHWAAQMTLLRQLSQIRREIEGLVCTATWAEDCLFRGAEYSPDFRCACPVCRELFPNRRYPRAVRESAYSLDCQVEADEDPEFAEELARLRNDRPRFGSVFLGRSGNAWGRASRGNDGAQEGES